MNIVWLLFAILSGVARSESVRDEVDTVFAIDDESISVNGEDAIIEFIESIALRESVGMYEQTIPMDFPKILPNLNDTETIHHRAPPMENMMDILRDSFEKIVSTVEDGGDSRAVSLMEVFNAMTTEDLISDCIPSDYPDEFKVDAPFEEESPSIISFDSAIISTGGMTSSIGSMTYSADTITADSETIDSYHAEYPPIIGSNQPGNQMIAESYIVGTGMKHETGRFLSSNSGEQLAGNNSFSGLLSVLLIALFASARVRYNLFSPYTPQ